MVFFIPKNVQFCIIYLFLRGIQGFNLMLHALVMTICSTFVVIYFFEAAHEFICCLCSVHTGGIIAPSNAVFASITNSEGQIHCSTKKAFIFFRSPVRIVSAWAMRVRLAATAVWNCSSTNLDSTTYITATCKGRKHIILHDTLLLIP